MSEDAGQHKRSTLLSLLESNTTESTQSTLSAMPPSAKFLNFKRRKTEETEAMESNLANKSTPMIINFYDPDVKGNDARHRTLDDILDWQNYQLERSHNYIQVLFPLPEGSPFNIDAPVVSREVFDTFRSRNELQARLRQSFVRMLRFYGFEILSEQEPKTEQKESEVAHQSNPAISHENVDDLHSHEDEVEERTHAQPPKDMEQKANEADESTSNTKSIESDSQPHESQQSSQPETQEHYRSLLADSAGPDNVPGTSSQLKIVRAPHWKESFSNWAIHFDHNHLRMTRILRSLRVLGLQAECDAFYTALEDVFNDPHIHINERTMSYWRKAVKQPLYIAPDGERIPWLREWEEEIETKREQGGN